MRRGVLKELEHIPKGNNAQNELRLIYFNRRMRSLEKKRNEGKTAKDLLMESIAQIKEGYPNFGTKSFFESGGSKVKRWEYKWMENIR